jgi:parvulin-like peptidyl-prolyl cis-trans isomerase-like protein
VRRPVLRFVILGVALFGLERALARPEPTPAVPAQAISDEALLYREAKALGLDRGDPSIRLRLVQKMRSLEGAPDRSDEAMYQEALALGLDEDVVVRRILVRKMQLLLEDGPPLQEGELRAYVESHRARYVRAGTVTFAHVFLSTGTPARAEALLRKLRARSFRPEEALRWSEPFPLGWHQAARTREELASRFGDDCAREVFALPVGQWSGPIASPYGLHLVLVEGRVPEQMPPLDAIRSEAALALQQERSAKSLATALIHLREVRP